MRGIEFNYMGGGEFLMSLEVEEKKCGNLFPQFAAELTNALPEASGYKIFLLSETTLKSD